MYTDWFLKNLSTSEIVGEIVKLRKANNIYKIECFKELKIRGFIKEKYTHHNQIKFFNWLEKNHPEYLV